MAAYPSLTVELPSDTRAPRAARQSMRSLESYVEPDVVEDVNLLVSELVTNSVRYGTVRSKKGICLDARPTPTGIRVEIRNAGGAMLANRLPHDPSPESGWGLMLVTRIASRWGITTNGDTVVWFEIDVDGTHQLKKHLRF